MKFTLKSVWTLLIMAVPIGLVAQESISLSSVNHPKADKNKKGMFTVHIETEINAPADKVWQVIGAEFAEIDKWSTTVLTCDEVAAADVPAHIKVASNAPVAGRRTVSEALDAVEILTAYSDSDRSFTFQTANTPGFVAFAQNNTQVTDLGNGKSTISFDIEMQLKGIFKIMKGRIQKRLSGAMKHVQGDLKIYVETGKPAEVAG